MNFKRRKTKRKGSGHHGCPICTIAKLEKHIHHKRLRREDKQAVSED